MSDRLLKESDVLRIAFQLPLVVNSAFADAVKALPSADRPTGKWVGAREFCQHLEEVTGEKYQVTGIGNMIYCNQCWQASRRRSKYCPDCGGYNGYQEEDNK